MRSRSEIIMDYNRVMGLADQLDSLAGKLKQEMDGTVRGTLDSLRAAWQGENSELFMSKSYDFISNAASSADSLQSFAYSIRSNKKRTATFEIKMRMQQPAETNSSIL